jgi:LuxR family maltose regulon positive regulatory protein
MGSLIEAQVVQALAHAAQGDLPRALVALERALILAEPEGSVRVFVDEGETMRGLLRQAAARGIAPGYTRRLLTAFGDPAGVASTPDRVAATGLAEPLTAREIEVLRLIAAGLRNEEIAGQLFISLATVKRHIANAYGKLGVSNRVEAVSQARELNLL